MRFDHVILLSQYDISFPRISFCYSIDKMLSNIRAFRYIYLGIVLLFVFTCWQLKRNGSNLLYDSLTKDRPKYRPGWYSMSKEKFVAAAVESGLDDSFDYTPIKTLCDAQIWDPSVVFTCHGIIGGIGKRYLA